MFSPEYLEPVRLAWSTTVKPRRAWKENIRDVQKAIIILVLFVDTAHEGGSWGKHFIHEDEDGLFGGEFDTLADHVDELTNGKVGWYQVLLLVDGSDI